MKVPKILFFVDGVAPTPDDMSAASEINAQVVFRNARAVPADGSLEECDGVAGHVPAPYKKLPSAAQAIKAHAAKVKALGSKVGDSPAPSAPASTGDADPPQTDASAAQEGAGAGGVPADPAKVVAPGAAPAGASGTAWKAN